MDARNKERHLKDIEKLIYEIGDSETGAFVSVWNNRPIITIDGSFDFDNIIQIGKLIELYKKISNDN